MTNLLREIGRRVTLVDLVQDSEKIDNYLKTFEEGSRKNWRKFGGYFSLAMRSIVRVGADAIFLYYAHEAYQKQEITPLLSGVFIGIFTYVVDSHVFDKTGYWREDDPK